MKVEHELRATSLNAEQRAGARSKAQTAKAQGAGQGVSEAAQEVCGGGGHERREEAGASVVV